MKITESTEKERKKQQHVLLLISLFFSATMCKMIIF